MITGASGGIGASFSEALSREGYDLILVARREEKLRDLAADLRSRYGIIADVLVADLARPSEIHRVEEKIKETEDLNILVNNAGSASYRDFVESDLETSLGIINVIITAAISLCHAALPKMIEKRNGIIINVASGAAFYSIPGLAVYSGAKSFLLKFSETLQNELAGTGVKIQALCPGNTRTDFEGHKFLGGGQKREGPAWMGAEEVVAASLGALTSEKVICAPGWYNKQQFWLAKRSSSYSDHFSIKSGWGEARKMYKDRKEK